LGSTVRPSNGRQIGREVWEEICGMNECKTHSGSEKRRIPLPRLLLHSFIPSLRSELVTRPTGLHLAAEDDELARSILLAAGATVLDNAEMEEWSRLPLLHSCVHRCTVAKNQVESQTNVQLHHQLLNHF
jgi:hypothetical protein